MNQTLLIFAKNLLLGKVKTRLAATAGSDVAFKVYRELMSHTVSVTTGLPVEKIVFYSDYIETHDQWDNSIYKKDLQRGDDLGTRMKNALEAAFAAGSDRVVIIGTDCFELSATIILQAFAELIHHDVVIGPAKDGGYYLLGMKKLHAGLFTEIEWSTEHVLTQTLAACSQHTLAVALLPELSDVDNENDLKRQTKLSTIIHHD